MSAMVAREGREQQEQQRGACGDHQSVVVGIAQLQTQMGMLIDRQDEDRQAVARLPEQTVALLQARLALPALVPAAPTQVGQQAQGEAAAGPGWARTVGAAVAGALAWAAGAGLIPSGQAQQAPQSPPPKPPAVEAPRNP